MRKHQNGITLIGWTVLLLPMAIVGYAAIRLIPAYLNHMSVARTLTQVAREHAGSTDVNAAALRLSLAKRFDIEAITRPTVDDLLIQREDGIWVLEAEYDVSVPLMAGISINVAFDNRVEVK